MIAKGKKNRMLLEKTAKITGPRKKSPTDSKL